MMNKPVTYAKWLALSLLLPAFFSVSGQGQLHINTRHLTVEDGLVGRRVNTMIQDNRGFIWLGTNEGLNRFDGHRFQFFSQEEFNFSGYGIRNLVLGPQGMIWIYYNNYNNLSLPAQFFDPNTYEVGSLDSLLKNRYDLSSTEERLMYRSHNEQTIVLRNNQKQYLFSRNDSLGLQQVEHKILAQGYAKNTYWIRRSDSLIEYRGKEIVRIVRTPSPHIQYVVPFSDDFLVARMQDPAIGQWRTYQYKPASGWTHLNEGGSGPSYAYGDIIWIHGHLYQYQSDGLVEIPLPAAMNFNPRSILVDRAGGIWLGTFNGVYLFKIQNKSFTTFLKDMGQGDAGWFDARGLWADQNQLIALSAPGSYRVDLHSGKATPTGPAWKKWSNDRFRSLTQGQDGQIWIAGQDTAIYQLDRESMELVQALPLGTRFFVWATLQGSDSTWWAGGIWNKLGKKEPGDSTFVPMNIRPADKPNALEGQITHLREPPGKAGWVWAASNHGWLLFHRDSGLVHRYHEESPEDFRIPARDIRYTMAINTHEYWVGTANRGLLHIWLDEDWQVKDYQQLTLRDGLPSNTVYAVFADARGYLWMSTDNGLSVMDPDRLAFQNFTEMDGLPHYEFNRSSFFKRDDGQLFFGTLNGLVSFHPDSIRPLRPYDVPLQLSEIIINSQRNNRAKNRTRSFLENGVLRIEPSDETVSFQVFLEDFFDAPRHQFLYKLEGYHDSYLVEDDPVIRLGRLPFGKKDLLIQARGMDGRMSTSILRIPIQVIRPIYLRWWFYVLVSGLIGLFFRAYLRWRTMSLRTRKLELEKEVTLRTQQLQAQKDRLALDKQTIADQAEELRSLDKMKSRFFANISHELRTPLTMILGPARRLQREDLDHHRSSSLGQLIYDQARHLLRRINEILDLTKLESNQMQVQQVPLRFYPFAHRLVSAFESLAQQKQQQLLFEYQLDRSLQIMLDADKVEHVFNNLLANAIKYTPEGGVIQVAWRKGSSEEQAVVLQVSDNGPGISPENMPHIFNRFYQAPDTINHSGGSGIGLALVRELADMLGAEIEVDSTVGKGSTFTFRLPYQEFLGVISGSEKGRMREGHQTIATVPASKQKGRPLILLVEDNATLRKYVRDLLEASYEVTDVANGHEAIVFLSSTPKPVDLIVSDIMMPILDGYALLDRLKSEPKWLSIPVIMLTARSEVKDKLRALRIGVDDYLLKPFVEEELLARIHNLLHFSVARQKNKIVSEPNESLVADTTSLSSADLVWLQEVESCLLPHLGDQGYNIDRLAGDLHLSRRQFQRRIHDVTGLSPNKYVREVKLQKARSLLEEGVIRTVAEAAYAVGFGTPKYFSALFRERFGKRASEFLS